MKMTSWRRTPNQTKMMKLPTAPVQEEEMDDEKAAQVELRPKENTGKKKVPRRRYVYISVLVSVFLAAAGVTALLIWIYGFPGLNGHGIFSSHRITIDQNLYLTVTNSTKRVLLQARLGLPFRKEKHSFKACKYNGSDICVQLEQARLLVYEREPENQTLCNEFHWMITDQTVTEFKDCFNLSSAHWYGGGDVEYQEWPLEKLMFDSKPEPYTMGDILQGKIGLVNERFWFSSKRVSITVPSVVPLWVSFSQQQGFCLTAKYTNSPYYRGSRDLVLKYKICQHPGLKEVHHYFVKPKLRKNINAPPENLFTLPINSMSELMLPTINQATVQEYMTHLKEYNFTRSVLQLETKWHDKVGNYNMSATLIPNLTGINNILHATKSLLNLLIDPSISMDLRKGRRARCPQGDFAVYIKEHKSNLPKVFNWNGKQKMLLNVKSPCVNQWIRDKIHFLQETMNITSFTIKGRPLFSGSYDILHENQITSPDDYIRQFARLVNKHSLPGTQNLADLGSQTQELFLFVTMPDLNPTWGSNGLKSIISRAMTYGLLGYPYILPGMVYNANGTLPDKELYIRWLQVIAFMPTVKFTVPPWQYDSDVKKAVQKTWSLRMKYSKYIHKLAIHAGKTGEPIIRPLWWIDENDEESLITDTQFLVGNDLLVAPVVQPAMNFRDIYLPAGLWNDELRNEPLMGGRKYVNYKADIHQLPHFTRAKL